MAIGDIEHKVTVKACKVHVEQIDRFNSLLSGSEVNGREKRVMMVMQLSEPSLRHPTTVIPNE